MTRMPLAFEYRSYRVRRDERCFRASPIDGEEGDIVSTSMDRLMKQIDQVWDELDNPHRRKPFWLRCLINRGIETVFPDRCCLVARTAVVLASALMLGSFLTYTDIVVIAFDQDRDGEVSTSDVFLKLHSLVSGGQMERVVRREDGSEYVIVEKLSEDHGIHTEVVSRRQLKPPSLSLSKRAEGWQLPLTP